MSENRVQSIDIKWRQCAKNDELVLVFRIGERLSGANHYLPHILEVESPPANPSSSRAVPDQRSFFTPSPCTYLDCTGMKFGLSSNNENSNQFSSLLVLSKHLRHIKYVKVLIIVQHELISNASPSSADWRLSFSSCPALHVLGHLPKSQHGSFGLVVVKQKERKKGASSTISKQEAQQQIKILRKSVLDNLKSVKNELRHVGNEHEMQPSSSGDSPMENENTQLLQNFFNAIIISDDFLVLELERTWNGMISSLVNLPSYSGFKIAKFCQRTIKISTQITNQLIWDLTRVVYGDCACFAKIATQLESGFKAGIESKTKSVLSSIIDHYSLKLKARPKRNDLCDLASAVSNTTDLCLRDCTIVDSYQRLMDLCSSLGYTIGEETYDALKRSDEQLHLLLAISLALLLPYQSDNVSKDIILFKKFNARFWKEIVPDLAFLLRLERENTCTKLTSLYSALTEIMMEYYSQNISNNLSCEQSRNEMIAKLAGDGEILQVLKWDTSSVCQLDVYRKLSLVKEPLPLNKLNEIKMLEKQHKSLDNSLVRLEQYYTSCQNHSAAVTSQKLTEHLEEIKGRVIKYDELVSQLENEIRKHLQPIVKAFQEAELNDNLKFETMHQQLQKISSIHEKLKERQANTEQAFHAEISLANELDKISKELIDFHVPVAAKIQIFQLQCQLKRTLRSSFPHQNANQTFSLVIQDYTLCFASLSNELANWKQCLNVVVFIKECMKSPRGFVFTRTYPLTTDDHLFRILEMMIPTEKKENLVAFRSFSWGTVKSLAMEMIKMLREEMKVELLSESVLLVSGNYLRFADLCRFKEFESAKLKEVRLLAREVLFIDDDLYDGMGRELVVTVIAPHVEVVGNRIITLDGKDGLNYSTPAADGSLTLHDGVGQQGRDGLPGKPGGNGGDFYLICDSIKNASSLRVYCRGGNGGSGQYGGKGMPGKCGRPADMSDLINGVGETTGQLGSSGGNGGDGGMSGQPGSGGTVSVKVFGTHDGAVKVARKMGEEGSNGKGGEGGKGGKNGDGFKRTIGIFWIPRETVTPCNTTASDGSRGSDGRGTTGCTFPQEKRKTYSLGNALSDFRFLIAMPPVFNGEAAKHLMAEIDNDKEFLCGLSPKLLAKDLLRLEYSYNFELHKQELVSEHTAFQDRLDKYCRWKGEENDRPDQESELILCLLNALSKSKVLVLNEHHNESDNLQVINLKGYFDVIANTIKQLESSHLTLNRQDALQNYHDYLQGKKGDIEKLISNTVLPTISQIEKEMHSEMFDCLAEMNAYGNLMEKDLRKRRVDYCIYRETVEKWETIRMTLSTVHKLCDLGLLFVMNPAIFAVFNVTKLATGGALSYVNEQYPDPPSSSTNVELPECLKVTSKKEIELLDRKEKEMIQQHYRVLNYFENHSEFKILFNPLLEEWKDSICKFQESRFTNVMDIQPALIQMEYHRAAVINELHHCKEIDMADDLDFLLVKLAIHNCVPVPPSFSSVENSDLSGIPDQEVRNIALKQMAMFQDLMPLMNNVTELLISMGNDSSTNKVNGKLKKWQLRSTLRNVKEKMNEFVKGLKSEKRLLEVVLNFEEIISLLIDMHVMTDKYKESEIFSKTIHQLTNQHYDISSNIGDPEVKKLIDKLNYLLRANTFLLEYGEATRAFKQWILPFAAKYPDITQQQLLVQDDLGSHNDEKYEELLQKLTIQYVEKFKTLQKHLECYRSMTMDIDSIVFTGRFDGGSKVNPPFFIWKWNEFGYEIGKLLDGDGVELRSDVWAASSIDDGRRCAVKFKSVELFMKHRKGFHSKEQKELNRVLKNYKITMVHSGVSYYRVFSQCFVIRGSKQDFSYSFDESIKNATYEKNKSSGDYLLSPYTVWHFKLDNVGGKENSLKKFKGQVNLELQGDGWFVDETAAKTKELDKTYLKDLQEIYELTDQRKREN